jgi:hypothetical protein
MKNEPKKNTHYFIESLYYLFKKKKGKLFLYGAMIGIMIFFATQRLLHIYKSPLDEYLLLEKAYSEWQSDLSSKEKYNKLVGLVKKHPNNAALLEPEIAQKLIYLNDSKYKPFASKILTRTSAEETYHSSYSKISLLVSEKKYFEAYNNSLELKAKMEKENNKHLVLYPYNLFRMCILAKQMKDGKKELEGWNELEKLIKEKETSFVTLLEKNNQFKLHDYISQRKLLLNEKSLLR